MTTVRSEVRRRTCGAGATLTAVALLAAACGGSSAGAGSQAPAGRTSPPATASPPAAAGPSPAATATAARRRAAARYLAISAPANRRLEHDFDHGLNGDDRGNLAASQADLRDAAATERRFDGQLLQIRLAPSTAAMARVLVAANQSRARLTDEAARSTSLARLRGFERRLDAANVPVEDAVKVIRSQLGLPPPESS